MIVLLSLSGDPQVATRLRKCAFVSPLSIVTPVNHAAARQAGIDALLGGRTVQPHFEYDIDLLSDLAGRRAQIAEDGQYILDHLVFSGQDSHAALDEFVKGLLENRLLSADALCRLAQAILQGDDGAAGQAVLCLYGSPETDIVRLANLTQARDSQASHDESNPTYYTDCQIAERFDRVIQSYGLPDYTAEVSSAVTAISVRDGKLYVPAGRTLKGVELARLVGHEIECHLRCRANTAALIQRIIGSNSGLSPLAPWLAKSIDETIHEGIAKISDVYVTEFFTGNGDAQQPDPWYVSGISRALNYRRTFDDTIQWAYHEYRQAGKSREASAKAAWTKTYRIYRGISDPSSHDYVYTKDAAYFTGYHQLRRLQTENPQLYLMAQDYSSLSAGELASLSDIRCQILHDEGSAAAQALFQTAYLNRHIALLAPQ